MRYYLNGVFVEAIPSETRMIATNGNCMGILREQKAGDDLNDVPALVGFIIPDTAIKAMLAWKAPKYFNETNISITVPDDYADNYHAEFRAEFAGNAMVFKRIDGKFPDYQRVVPKTVSGIAGNFNPDYLAISNAAKQDIHGKNAIPPVLLQNGPDGAAIQLIAENFFAVIMPLRADAKPEIVADTAWALVPLAMPKDTGADATEQEAQAA